MNADGTVVETTGKIFIPSIQLGAFKLFDMEFHILPGLPSDVIFGEEFLDRIDAFNTCSELKDTEDPYQHSLNILINLGPIQAFLSRGWNPETGNKVQLEHDGDIEVEIYRRNKADALYHSWWVKLELRLPKLAKKRESWHLIEPMSDVLTALAETFLGRRINYDTLGSVSHPRLSCSIVPDMVFVEFYAVFES